MARYAYERLSAQDNSFLLLERPNVHMHVAATMIYEAGPLRTAEGGVDIQSIRKAVESVLHLIPRYRQKLKWIRFENHPVWIDDRRFNIEFHVRHTALPRPGSDEQLRTLAARIMAQQLDRRKPLWEMWVVEGLKGGDRFAIISKVHHCMIDGASGVDLAQILMSPSPEHEVSEPMPYIPRPAPSSGELLLDQWQARFSLPLAALRGLREVVQRGEDMRDDLRIRVRALSELLGYAFSAASDTPLNGRLGPHRRVEWVAMSLDDVKAVRRALGCTVNDLVLGTVAGAVRSYMIRRRVDPAQLEFRVAAPVSIREEADRGKLGNKVSSWIVRLPIAEADPVKRLKAICDVTRELKESHKALGVAMLMAAAEWTPGVLLSLGSRAVSGPINMIVTNVPGPQFPLYMLGARLLDMYPVVPLLENTGLGIALFSYDGKLLWGLNADSDLIPDLPAFAKAIQASFNELKKAATPRPATESKAASSPVRHLSAVEPRGSARTPPRRPRKRGRSAASSHS